MHTKWTALDAAATMTSESLPNSDSLRASSGHYDQMCCSQLSRFLFSVYSGPRFQCFLVLCIFQVQIHSSSFWPGPQPGVSGPGLSLSLADIRWRGDLECRRGSPSHAGDLSSGPRGASGSKMPRWRRLGQVCHGAAASDEMAFRAHGLAGESLSLSVVAPAAGRGRPGRGPGSPLLSRAFRHRRPDVTVPNLTVLVHLRQQPASERPGTDSNTLAVTGGGPSH